jgi:hypothetical protein
VRRNRGNTKPVWKPGNFKPTVETRAYQRADDQAYAFIVNDTRVRVAIVGVVVIALFSALLGRLWFLQVASDEA